MLTSACETISYESTVTNTSIATKGVEACRIIMAGLYDGILTKRYIVRKRDYRKQIIFLRSCHCHILRTTAHIGLVEGYGVFFRLRIKSAKIRGRGDHDQGRRQFGDAWPIGNGNAYIAGKCCVVLFNYLQIFATDAAIYRSIRLTGHYGYRLVYDTEAFCIRVVRFYRSVEQKGMEHAHAYIWGFPSLQLESRSIYERKPRLKAHSTLVPRLHSHRTLTTGSLEADSAEQPLR